jgi:small subunit ribosomal protein S9
LSKSKKVLVLSGKRKTATARATVRVGKGRVRINNIPLEIYEPKLARDKILEPLLLTDEKVLTKSTRLRTALRDYDRTMIAGDPRRSEPKKFGGPGARARDQKSYR